MTYHTSITLEWGQLKYSTKVALRNLNNVATSNLSPEYRDFEAYKAKLDFNNIKENYPLLCNEANIKKMTKMKALSNTVSQIILGQREAQLSHTTLCKRDL